MLCTMLPSSFVSSFYMATKCSHETSHLHISNGVVINGRTSSRSSGPHILCHVRRCVLWLNNDHNAGHLQEQAYTNQEMLCQNMCADFLSVSKDSLGINKYLPEAESLVSEFVPRSQDVSFATNLAAVVVSHARSLASQLLGMHTRSASLRTSTGLTVAQSSISNGRRPPCLGQHSCCLHGAAEGLASPVFACQFASVCSLATCCALA